MDKIQSVELSRNSGGRMELFCPQCKEELLAADIENFHACPFCGCKLKADSNLEDFILEPVVRHWVGKNQNPL